ncbi:MAG: toxin TcdB middle/N-terminal domain-containing protein [Patescibacteria group bacterium]
MDLANEQKGMSVWKVLTIIAIIKFIVFFANAVFAADSGVAPNVISLPSGPGSISGLGEEFTASANSGTASYGIGLEVPAGSGGLSPSLKILYNGGGGNSALGFAWSMSLPRIQRQTDKGLPRYASQDTYLYQDGSVSEELVPLADGSFRLKNEGAFIKAVFDGASWEVRTKEGLIYTLGKTAASRVQDEGGTKVFAWNVISIEDRNGNSVSFEWSSDAGQSYLNRVAYNDYGPQAICEVLFTYELRQDALADYRAGFPVVTTRRMRGVEVKRGGNVVRTYSIAYASGSALSKLARIVLTGSDGSTSMPALSFGYTAFVPKDKQVVEMDNPPGQGLMDSKNALVDINADSLPDLLVSSPGNYAYYLNVDGTQWESQAAMSGGPSYDLSQPGVKLADIDGDGLSDLVIARADGNKYMPGNGTGGWSAAVPFDLNPVGFDLSDANTRFADVNGDRMIDVVHTGATGVSVWIHEGEGDYLRLTALPKIDSSEDVLFSDPKVHLADMNGDGLVDVAKLRSESLIYWPSKGYGSFDGPVAVGGAPHVEDESRLRLADINGDGLADVIYLGVGHVAFWLNLGDGTLGDQVTISGTPSVDPISTSIQLADMNGNGTTDIVWVDVSGGPDGAWQYLDLIGDTRAGLLNRIDNGIGKVVSIEYESSTSQMVRAAQVGEPWQGALPFPVSVVKEVRVDDSLGAGSTKQYAYGDGYYDGVEREFRGFAKSTMIDKGGASIPSLNSITEFDVGMSGEALKGKTLNVELRSDDGVLFRSTVNSWNAVLLDTGSDGRRIEVAELVSEVTSVFEGGASPRYLRKDYGYDEYGNVTDEVDHGEVTAPSDNGSTPYGNDEAVVHRDYINDESKWLVGKVGRETVYDSHSAKVAETVHYYDGAVFQGLPFGQIDHGNPTRTDKWLDTENRYVSVERYRRDSWGNITAMLDPEGGRREIAYDSLSHTYPAAERVFTDNGAIDFAVEYDSVFGKVSSFTDPNGAASRFDYDPLGRLSVVVRPLDSAEFPTVQYQYFISSPMSVIVTKQREVSGQTGTLDSYNYIDGLGRTRAEAVEDVDGRIAVTKAVLYNSRGKESYSVEPFRCQDASSCSFFGSVLFSKSGSEHEYDVLGRLKETINPDGTTARVEYLPLARLIYDENDTDTASSHKGTPTRKTYDGRGRMLSVSYMNAGENVATDFSYDVLGNILSITDPAGNVRNQEYDSMGRMTAVIDPNAGRREYVYDDAGRLIEKRKPDGLSIKYKYEPTTGRMLSKNYVSSVSDDSWEIVYHYDAASGQWDGHGSYLIGKLAWIEDEAGKEYYGYDVKGRLIAKRRTIGSKIYDLGYDYDAADRQVSLRYPDGASLALSYDARGLIQSVGNYLLERSYTASGQVETELLSGGIVRGYSYDTRGRLSSLSAVNAEGSVIQAFEYSYDSASNIADIRDQRQGETTANQTQSFVYDDLYRLTGAQLAEGGLAWSYDIVGNITGRDSTLPDGKYHEPDMLYGDGAGPYAMTRAGDKRYEYDVNGNLVTMPGQSLMYDAEDRLSKVTKEDGTVVEMTYDHTGQRKVKKVLRADGAVSETIYADPFFEERGDKAYRYVWAAGRRIARVESSASEQSDE